MTACSNSFMRVIGLTAIALRNFADQRLKNFDLTMEQLQVIKQLDRQLGRTQRELSLDTDKSPANITRLLDRLEKKGWIERQVNPEDRRSSLVYLTEAGELGREQVTAMFEEVKSQLLVGVSAQEQSQVAAVLDRIRENTEKITGS